MWANKMLSNALHIAHTTAKGGIIAEKNAFDNEKQAESSYARSSARVERAKPNGQLRASKFISLGQATKIMEAVRLDKWMHRRGIVFAGAWVRERQAGGQSDVVHCHLLFHLPLMFRAGKKLRQVEAAITRLVKRHGRDITDERVIKLVIHDNPDGKYLIDRSGALIEPWPHRQQREGARAHNSSSVSG